MTQRLTHEDVITGFGHNPQSGALAILFEDTRNAVNVTAFGDVQISDGRRFQAGEIDTLRVSSSAELARGWTTFALGLKSGETIDLGTHHGEARDACAFGERVNAAIRSGAPRAAA